VLKIGELNRGPYSNLLDHVRVRLRRCAARHFLRAALPKQHQSMESKDVLKLMSPILEKRSKTLRKVKSFT
jgi:hypothetical protein